MAKIGYIMAISQYDRLEEDRRWMNDYGCIRIVEESDENERNRPLWKQLMVALQRGDELVISKFSNALRGSREPDAVKYFGEQAALCKEQSCWQRLTSFSSFLQGIVRASSTLL